jgi:hypothetical protein
MRLFVQATFLIALLFTTSAPAAIVTYGLDLSVPGEFQIFASASTGDNDGLVCYGVPLTAKTTAMITSFEQLSPAADAVEDGNSVIGSAGFTTLRSTYTMPNKGLTFFAAQNTIGGTPHLIRGLGQTAGSFSDLGLSPFGTSVQPAWNEQLLIARGTYSGNVNDFHIDTRNVDLVANVFDSPTSLHTPQAEVRVTGANGYNYTPLPPPAPPIVEPVITPPVNPVPPPALPEPDNIVPPPAADPVVPSPPLGPPLANDPQPFEPAEHNDIPLSTIPPLHSGGQYFVPAYPFLATIDIAWMPEGQPHPWIDLDHSVFTGLRNRAYIDTTDGDWPMERSYLNYTGIQSTALSVFDSDGLSLALLHAGIPEPNSVVLAGVAFLAASAFTGCRQRG